MTTVDEQTGRTNHLPNLRRNRGKQVNTDPIVGVRDEGESIIENSTCQIEESGNCDDLEKNRDLEDAISCQEYY